MKFFISYTTRDKEITIDLLRTISTIFKGIGKVFIDIIDNDSVDKQRRVFMELEASDYLILINTESVQKSNWVLKELKRAKQLGIPTINLCVSEINSLRGDKLKEKLTPNAYKM